MAGQLSRELLMQIIAKRVIESADIFDSQNLMSLLPFSVQFFITSEECKRGEAADQICGAACELETWTITWLEDYAYGVFSPTSVGPRLTIYITKFTFKAKEEGTVAPIFLKQAVRSHLHFSPIHSWLLSHNNCLPKGLRIVHRLTASCSAQPCREGEVEHNFPKCRIDLSVLQVSVRWLKKERYPSTPILVACPCSRVDCNDWEEPATDEVIYGAQSHGITDGLNRLSLRRPISAAKADNVQEGKKVRNQNADSPLVGGQKNPRFYPKLLGALQRWKNELPGRSMRLRRSSGSLLLNFEESALNGRLPSMTNGVDGFRLKLSIISNSPFHFPIPISLPVRTYYFDATDGRTSHLYLATCDVVETGSKQLGMPGECTIQAMVLKPNGSIANIFDVPVNLNGMPCNTRTFVRQRTLSATAAESLALSPNGSAMTSSTQPSSFLTTTSYLEATRQPSPSSPSSLKSLIHLRVFSDNEAKIYLHGDLRMLLSSNRSNEESAETTKVIVMEGRELSAAKKKEAQKWI